MPLPAPAKQQADYSAVKADILKAMATENLSLLPADPSADGGKTYAARLAYLAYQVCVHVCGGGG